MSNEQRITILKQEIYDLLQTYKVAIKKYMNEKDPIIKKLLHDSIIKLCKMDQEKRKTLSILENIIRKKEKENKGTRYCYVRLYNPFIDYDKLNNVIIVGDSLRYSTIPGISQKEISIKTFFGIKTRYVDDPFPIICKSIDNKQLFDLVTKDEYVLIDKYDSKEQTIKYKGNLIDVNPRALTNVPAFTISQYISEDDALNIVKSLEQVQKERYISRMNILKEIINESYNNYLCDSSNKEHEIKFVNLRKLMR